VLLLLGVLGVGLAPTLPLLAVVRLSRLMLTVRATLLLHLLVGTEVASRQAETREVWITTVIRCPPQTRSFD
jgi:hypothetical protein